MPLIMDRATPTLPACHLLITALDGDSAAVDALIGQVDQTVLVRSLLKLVGMLGFGQYGMGLRDQVTQLAAALDAMGEETGVPRD